ncbi:hypothetical protein HDU76_007188 [Blyttiomyces sp. JEL0837]|nr:hypothetical protein HDU76_007188 [Blyttiomyces sp. JEL0837]
MTLPAFFGKGKGVLIDPEDCEYVGNFIITIQTSMELRNPPQELALYPSDGDDAVPYQNDCLMEDISLRPGYVTNSEQQPLLIKHLAKGWKESHLYNQDSADDTAPAIENDIGNPLSAMKLDADDKFCLTLGTFHQQFKFLDSVRSSKSQDKCFARSPHDIAWIIGPGGSGKTVTTLAYLSTIDRKKWAITWFHFQVYCSPVCVQYVDGEKRFKKIGYEITEDVTAILEDVGNQSYHVVFLDGFKVDSNFRHDPVMDVCVNWLKGNENKRRLVITSSGRPYSQATSADTLYIDAWTLDDYRNAVQCMNGFVNVNEYLNAVVHAKWTTQEEMIVSKYYFAGGDARLMFTFETDYIIEILKRAIMTNGRHVMTHISMYMKHGLNCGSEDVLTWKGTDDGSYKPAIFSQYAADQLALQELPCLAHQIATTYYQPSNPSSDHMLLQIFTNFQTGAVTDVWPKASYPDLVDPTNFSVDVVNICSKWWRPTRRHYGGYDGVYVDSWTCKICTGHSQRDMTTETGSISPLVEEIVSIAEDEDC